jgi:hypothetical protein
VRALGARGGLELGRPKTKWATGVLRGATFVVLGATGPDLALPERATGPLPLFAFLDQLPLIRSPLFPIALSLFCSSKPSSPLQSRRHLSLLRGLFCELSHSLEFALRLGLSLDFDRPFCLPFRLSLVSAFLPSLPLARCFVSSSLARADITIRSHSFFSFFLPHSVFTLTFLVPFSFPLQKDARTHAFSVIPQ